MFSNIIHTILFYIIAFGMVITSLGIIFLPNLLHSCISMFLAFLSGGILFIILDSDFLGVEQIAVYAIAICILFSIIIMLVGQKSKKIEIVPLLPKLSIAFISIFIIFAVLLFALTNGFSLFNKVAVPFSMSLNIGDLNLLLPSCYSIKLLAINLLSNYIFSFELISLAIVIVLAGVVSLNSMKKSDKGEKENE